MMAMVQLKAVSGKKKPSDSFFQTEKVVKMYFLEIVEKKMSK